MSEPAIEWLEGQAEALPLPDAQFDAVVSQFGLMYFEDRPAALREIGACCGPAGAWSWLSGMPWTTCPASRRWRRFSTGSWARRRGRRCGRRSCSAIGPRWPRWSAAAGIPGAEVETRDGTARFPSIEDWVRTEVKGWTLADQVDEDSYRRLQRAARDELRDFAASDGAVAFAVSANLVVARKP